MEKDTKKQLLKYARAPLWYVIIGACSVLFGFIMGYCMGVNTRDIVPFLIFTLGLGGFGGYYIVLYIISDIKLRRRIAQAEKNGEALILQNDFKNAERAFGGALVLGDVFVIAKDSGNILTYKELQKMQSMSEDNGGIRNYTIYVQTPSRRKMRLCRVDRRMIDPNEPNAVYDYMMSKNPELRPGQII